MNEGVAELRQWLQDLAADGLTAHPTTTMELWEDRARRLNDAQMPALAQRLLSAGRLALTQGDRPERLADALGLLHLLLNAQAQRNALAPTERADLDAALGLPQRETDIDPASCVADTWLCMGEAVESAERLTVRRSWLRGRESGRLALVLGFGAGSRPLPPGPAPGVSCRATLGFFASADPLCAAVLGEGWAHLAAATPRRSRASASRPSRPRPTSFPRSWPRPCAGRTCRSSRGPTKTPGWDKGNAPFGRWLGEGRGTLAPSCPVLPPSTVPAGQPPSVP